MNKDNIVKEIHSSGIKNAKKVLPEKEVVKIIKLVFECLEEKKTPEEAAAEIYDDYKPAINAYINAFKKGTQENIRKYIDEKIKIDGFSKHFENATKNMRKDMKAFMNGEINEVEFIDKLCSSGIGTVIKDVADRSNIDLDKLLNIEISAAAYLAFSEAYKILMEALNDASVAYENRLIIEKECKESIELLKAYRSNMEETISEFFIEHLEIFNDRLVEMNNAIMNNDPNGYIRGNVAIQKELEYHVQFTNLEEFDTLMDSDNKFKL